jgi:predicted transcriptional regulator
MNVADKVIKSAFESDEVFQKTLSAVIKEDLNLTAVDFAKKANIPRAPSIRSYRVTGTLTSKLSARL